MFLIKHVAGANDIWSVKGKKEKSCTWINSNSDKFIHTHQSAPSLTSSNCAKPLCLPPCLCYKGRRKKFACPAHMASSETLGAILHGKATLSGWRPSTPKMLPSSALYHLRMSLKINKLQQLLATKGKNLHKRHLMLSQGYLGTMRKLSITDCVKVSDTHRE